MEIKPMQLLLHMVITHKNGLNINKLILLYLKQSGLITT